MSYIALYRKWRPQSFDEVVEQEHAVRAIKNTVISGRIAHAYLFSGTRGTGKTTLAKIFAKAINCQNPENGNPCNKCEICEGINDESVPDVLEIDAASNNGVDNIRDIKEGVGYSPVKARYKVYIIDEVHMLSTAAFNALLKTLEEPPDNVVFILATTDPQKLPATIISRCQRYDFRRISEESIADRLVYIAENADAVLTKDASLILARLADGALRDGISMLDQCISSADGEITAEVVRHVTGISGGDVMINLTYAVINNESVKILNTVKELTAYGKDIQRFTTEYTAYCRDMLVCSVDASLVDLTDRSISGEKIIEQAGLLGLTRLSYMINELSALDGKLRYATQPGILLETTLLRLAALTPSVDVNLTERVALLEEKINSGVFEVKKSLLGNSGRISDTPLSVSGEVQGNDTEVTEKGGGGAKKEKVLPGKFELWGEVLEDISSNEHVLLYTFLRKSAAYVCSNELYCVVPERNFFVHINRQEYIDVVQKSVFRVMGGDPKVRIYESEEDLPDDIPAEEIDKNDDSAPSQPKSPEDKAKQLAQLAGVRFEVE